MGYLRQHWISALVTLLVFLGTVIYSAPITYFTGFLESLTGGRVRLVNTTGTLFSGQGQLVFQGKDHWVLLPGDVHWSTKLSSQGWQWKIQDDRVLGAGKDLQISLTPFFGQVSSGQCELQAEILESLGGIAKTLQLRGTLTLAWENMKWSWAQQSILHPVVFEVGILHAHSVISPLKELGSYKIKGVVSPLGGHFDVTTEVGPLMIEGHGNLSAQGMQFDGQASSVAGMEEQLNGLLLLMGNVNGKVARLHY